MLDRQTIRLTLQNQVLIMRALATLASPGYWANELNHQAGRTEEYVRTTSGADTDLQSREGR